MKLLYRGNRNISTENILKTRNATPPPPPPPDKRGLLCKENHGGVMSAGQDSGSFLNKP